MDLTRVNEFGISGEAQASQTTPNIAQQDGVPVVPANSALGAITEGPLNGLPAAVVEKVADAVPPVTPEISPDSTPEALPPKTAEEKKKD